MELQIFTTLKIVVNALYNAHPLGTPDGQKHWNWFKTFSPGDLVMEYSTVWMNQKDSVRFGHLISDSYEPMYSEEEWEEVKDQYEERPVERVYRIRLLKDGSEMKWTNAQFIRVPDNMDIAADFHGVTRTGKPFKLGR